MKKTANIVLVLLSVLLAVGCSDNSFKGFYEEDLSKFIELGEYKGLSYTVPSNDVTDEEVSSEINAMLEARTELVRDDGKINSDSSVKLDRYCFIGGIARPELSDEGAVYSLSTSYDDEVINQLLDSLLDKKRGDNFEASVTVPKGYKGDIADDLEATYRITVTEVYKRSVPKLSDSIASTLLPGCNSVNELKNEIKNRLAVQKAEQSMDMVKSSLKDKIISSSKIIKNPMPVLNDYYKDIKALYDGLAKVQGMTLEGYVGSVMQMSVSDFEDMLSERAAEETKEALVLYSIVKAEKIEVNDKLLSKYASDMANRSGGTFASGEEYMTYYGKNAVTEDFLWSKALEIAVEKGVQK